MIKSSQHKFLYKLCLFIFSLLLISWVVLASMRIILNTTKVFTEEQQWIFASENQKREMVYGDIFIMYQHLDKITTKESNIYLLSNDAKQFFILRYLLYPKKIFWVKDTKTIKKTTTADYVLFYHLPQPKNISNFLPIKTFKTENTSSYLFKII